MDYKNSTEELFSKDALAAKQNKYGRLINPIGKFPTSYLLICLSLIFIFLWFAKNYKFENYVTLSGVTLLKNKPVKIVSQQTGSISKKFVNNGDSVESNVPIYSVVNCDLILVAKCEKESLIMGQVNGTVEQLYKSIGDFVKINEPLGIIVPLNDDIVFEFYIPVGLSGKLKLNDVLEVEILNPFASNLNLVSTKVIFKSKIPIEKNNNRYYILTSSPIDQALKVPVGSTVKFKIKNSSKAFFDFIRTS